MGWPFFPGHSCARKSSLVGLHPVSWEAWLKQRGHTPAPGSLWGSWEASYSSLVCPSRGGGWPSSSVWKVQCKLAGEQLDEDNYQSHSTHSRGELNTFLILVFSVPIHEQEVGQVWGDPTSARGTGSHLSLQPSMKSSTVCGWMQPITLVGATWAPVMDKWINKEINAEFSCSSLGWQREVRCILSVPLSQEKTEPTQWYSVQWSKSWKELLREQDTLCYVWNSAEDLGSFCVVFCFLSC